MRSTQPVETVSFSSKKNNITIAKKNIRVAADPAKTTKKSKNDANKPVCDKNKKESIDSLRSIIASEIVVDGNDAPFTTFDSIFDDPSTTAEAQQKMQLPLVYCDQTSSNRAVKSIEQYMAKHSLPFYANTQTTTSMSGSQTSSFVAEARRIVAEETNAKIDGNDARDVVLFAGSGTTSAVHLLIDALGIKQAVMNTTPSKRPVVFTGPYEHHSNILPWKESGCEVVMIPECPKDMTVDLVHLEALLRMPCYQGRVKMGTFSAASNITGKISNVDRIAKMLHKYGALAFFDYAVGAPYLKIDMNPTTAGNDNHNSSDDTAKDAVFFSPHKMMGGIGTPGVLIVKKHLIDIEKAPGQCGGGTMLYVTHANHRYLKDPVERYEGGTPNVPGIIRVGLTFLLKKKTQEEYMRIREKQQDQQHPKTMSALKNVSGGVVSIPRSMAEFDLYTHKRVVAHLKKNAPNLVLLGVDDEVTSQNHLPIFSFMIRFGERFLHHGYVCEILNNVFGIQSSGGCQCAEPYAQKLLGLTKMALNGTKEIPNEANNDIMSTMMKHEHIADMIKPGFTRLSLPFKGLHPEEVGYVIQALVWVAKNGWALMCNYRCDHLTGQWIHQGCDKGAKVASDGLCSLRQYESLSLLENGKASSTDHTRRVRSRAAKVEVSSRGAFLRKTLANADQLLSACVSDHDAIARAMKAQDLALVVGSDAAVKLEELRWFVYPCEVAKVLSSQSTRWSLNNKNNKEWDAALEGPLNPYHHSR